MNRPHRRSDDQTKGKQWDGVTSRLTSPAVSANLAFRTFSAAVVKVLLSSFSLPASRICLTSHNFITFSHIHSIVFFFFASLARLVVEQRGADFSVTISEADGLLIPSYRIRPTDKYPEWRLSISQPINPNRFLVHHQHLVFASLHLSTTTISFLSPEGLPGATRTRTCLLAQQPLSEPLRQLFPLLLMSAQQPQSPKRLLLTRR
jgi:hypothetical protein